VNEARRTFSSSRLTGSTNDSGRLTCDFLRYEVNGSSWSNFQLRNLEWLHHLMAGLSGSGLDFASVALPDDARELRSAIDNPSAVAEYVAGSQYAWAERYDAETLDVFPRLLETLCALRFRKSASSLRHPSAGICTATRCGT
jgi:hypothetical protein